MKSKVDPVPMEPDCRRQHDEYLDGHQALELEVRRFTEREQSELPEELTEHQREKLRAGMLELKTRLAEQRRYASMGPIAGAVTATADLVNASAWTTIRDLFYSGKITAAQAAWLYELRQLLAWRRLPWWDRLITRLLGGGP